MKDEEIIKKILKGDTSLFELLFEKYVRLVQSRIYKVIGHIDTEDIVQEVFYRAFKFLKTFDPQKSSFGTWISTISHNTSVDHIRKNKDRPVSIESFFDDDNELQIIDQSETKRMGNVKNREFLLYCISKLTPKYSEIIMLRYFQDLSYEDISLSLNIPPGTVMTRLFRAKQRLIKLMKRTGGLYE